MLPNAGWKSDIGDKTSYFIKKFCWCCDSFIVQKIDIKIPLYRILCFQMKSFLRFETCID